MSDRIELRGLTAEARHGVFPEEKATPQRFEVDLALELDLGPAGRSDDLARTVDYAAVAELVRAILIGPSVDLVETLAERIATTILGAFPPVDAVVVTVTKPDVRLALPSRGAAVTIRRTRPAWRPA